LPVAAWYLEKAAVEAGVAEIEGEGGVGVAVVADLTRPDEIEGAWDATDGLGGPVRYLVNNAGPASTTKLSVAEGVRIAVGSYAAMTEAFVTRHGPEAESVVFTASTAGNFMVGETTDWYPAAKAGIVGYMRHVAVKYHGCPRANAIAPGGTVTRRTEALYATAAMQERLGRHPMGRAGEADEVAAAICFCLSPAASFVNGVLIPVDGAVTWVNP
jgi:NAD(P)-dependent dehydrogenase (short-subunit alcohol dehydrogenase family)